jgi:Sulfotransferase family
VAEVPALPDHFLDVAIVFIVGCARSGTSILGEVVAAHPRVTYLYEVSSIWNRVFPDRPDDRLTAADASPEAVERLEEELGARIADRARDVLIEKNPKHTLRIPLLDAAFPACQIVHLIRDGRDTVASLMFRNRGPQWGHLRIPGWADLLARYPEENHIRCAHQWRDSVTIGREDGRKLSPLRYHEVRFETLVEKPRETVEGLMAFLGLGVTPEMEAVIPRIRDSTSGSYHARRQVRHYVDDHRLRVGRFRENLSEPQVAEVLAVCGDLLRELGYV